MNFETPGHLQIRKGHILRHSNKMMFSADITSDGIKKWTVTGILYNDQKARY